MPATYPTKLKLAFNSGGRCAFDSCRVQLVKDSESSDKATIGQAAHIHGEHGGNDKKPPSARYLPSMTDEERNHYDNLIYLCPNCHSKIDQQEEDYPADLLFSAKADHEAWVSAALDEGMSDVTFAELDIAAKAISTGKFTQAGDLTVIAPEEKIQKNSLTAEVTSLLTSGISRSHEVGRYLAKQSALDDSFPDRLKSGFRDKYSELKQSMVGDELFFALLSFAQDGQKDFVQQAASLAILSHLFHICEVFEK